MDDKFRQEKKCLEVICFLDQVRVRLFEIDDFQEFERYDKLLKQLKNKIHSIYWNL